MPVRDSFDLVALERKPVNYPRHCGSQSAEYARRQQEFRDQQKAAIGDEIVEHVYEERSRPESKWERNEHRMNGMSCNACFACHTSFPLRWSEGLGRAVSTHGRIYAVDENSRPAPLFGNLLRRSSDFATGASSFISHENSVRPPVRGGSQYHNSR